MQFCCLRPQRPIGRVELLGRGQLVRRLEKHCKLSQWVTLSTVNSCSSPSIWQQGGAASTPLVGQKLHEQGVIICSMGVQPPGPLPVNLHSVYTTTVHVLPTNSTELTTDIQNSCMSHWHKLKTFLFKASFDDQQCIVHRCRHVSSILYCDHSALLRQCHYIIFPSVVKMSC